VRSLPAHGAIGLASNRRRSAGCSARRPRARPREQWGSHGRGGPRWRYLGAQPRVRAGARERSRRSLRGGRPRPRPHHHDRRRGGGARSRVRARARERTPRNRPPGPRPGPTTMITARGVDTGRARVRARARAEPPGAGRRPRERPNGRTTIAARGERAPCGLRRLRRDAQLLGAAGGSTLRCVRSELSTRP
jgi:hypothetical protein